jgi:hypothetical protein
MRPDDAEDGDTLEFHLDQTSAATVSKLLREALQVRFDVLDDFEEWTIADAYDNPYRFYKPAKA